MDMNEVFNRHGDQMWGDLPYRVHLENVAMVATKLEFSDTMFRLALSHDLLEDTDTQPEELDEDIRDSTILVSRNYSQKRGMSYQEWIQFIADSDDLRAKRVKLADAMVNWALCRFTGNDLIRRYQRSIPTLWDSLYTGDMDWSKVEELIVGIKLTAE